MLTVITRKFYSQISNGEDFSQELTNFAQNLVGSVMERIRAEIAILHSVKSIASASDTFTVNGTAKTITTEGTTWSEDGWFVGDTFAVTGSLTFTGTIIALDGLELTYTLGSGTDTSGPYTSLNVFTTTDYLAASWQFGLPENGDLSENFTNIVDGSDQAYTVNSILTTYKTMNPAPGAKSWITGDARIKRTAIVSGECTYTIQQDFIIQPYYLAEIEQNLIDGTSPVDFFEGISSLKFIWNLEVRKVLSDPNISHSLTETDQLGSVGWFGENYNGFVNNYTLTETRYNDVASGDIVGGFQVDARTRVTCTITSAGLFSAASKAGGYFSPALDPVDYAANPTPFAELWMFDNYVKLVDNTYTGLTGVIKRFSSTLVSASEVEVSYDVEFTAAQQARLIDGQRFIVGMQVVGADDSRPLSDVVMLLGDFGTFIKNADVAGLLEFTNLDFIYHPQDESEIGKSNVRGWIEDGILSRLRFTLDPAIPSRLQQLQFKLLARNSEGREFVIQSLPMDLSSGLLQSIGGGQFKQAFNLDTTRGFHLVTGDFFNRVRLREYSNESGYRYGEYDQSAASQAVLYDSSMALPHTLLWDNNDGIDLTISNEIATGFTSAASVFGGSPAPRVSYISVQDGASITGIRAGRPNLVAGSNLITFATLGTVNYTVFAFDPSGNAIDLTGLIASQTATGFTVVAGLPGVLRWIAVRNTGLSDIRSGNVSIGAGSTPVNFSSTFGTTDYTLLLLDLENTGNIYGRNKTVDGFDISAGIATSLNYIAILNP